MSFDPQKYLRKVSGQDYLEVKWRLVWLREQHPDAVIATELVDYRQDHAIFRACVTLPSGASATGYGSEDPKGFKDFIEKAETKAIGRALGALGFGTQFADDFADAEGPLADAPVHRPTSRQQAPTQPKRIDTMTGPQRNLIIGLGKQLGMVKADGHHDEVALDDALRKAVGAPLAELTKAQAGDAIERMQRKKAEGGQGSRPINTGPMTQAEMDAVDDATPTSVPLPDVSGGAHRPGDRFTL